MNVRQNMNRRTAISAVIASVLLGGCSVVNVLKTDADYERHYYAKDLKAGIDSEIVVERKKGSPGGHLTEPYSQDLWFRYWADRLASLKKDGFAGIKDYRGPSADWFADYIITERRKVGLPEIPKKEPNQPPEPTAASGRGSP